MTSPRRFEQDLPALLTDLYLAGTPDYRDDLVQQIARVRQRPAWTFPERWLPMDLATKAMPGAPRIPWRIVGVLALLAVLLAALLAFYAGSQKPLPAPFGRAANGSIAYAAAGDIYTADPITGTTTAIVADPATDIGPVYSLDGTRFVFERKVEGDDGPGRLYVSSEGGRSLVQVTPDPILGLSGWSFSPDGRSIVALATGDRGTAIIVLPSDGKGDPRIFDIGLKPEDGPPRYRPNGLEIMFNGSQSGSEFRGIYVLDPASGDVRTVIAASPSADVHAAAWSPDGSRIAYAVIDPNMTDVPSSRTHVISADGSGDVVVDTHPDSVADFGDQWSNDGTRLIIGRVYRVAGGQVLRPAVVPIDRSSAGVGIECPHGPTPDDCDMSWIWSPDDSILLGAPNDESGGQVQQYLADPLTGEIRPASWTATGNPAWQRLAP
jgi:dipeptidyl aminopeptidase/acylaminoacyl peptidase